MRFPTRSLVVLALAGCNTSGSRPEMAVAKTLPCATASGGLFPDSTLRKQEAWYGKHLRALRGTSLCPASSPSTEAYRFLWLRSFHHPVLVAAERTGGRATLRVVESSGAGGYEPGRVTVDTAFALTEDQWASLVHAVDSASFWNPAVSRPDSMVGVDGAEWIFEGVRSGRYRAEDVWSPGTRGMHLPFRALGITFLRLAGRLPVESELY
jgi:hypothetical protein